MAEQIDYKKIILLCCTGLFITLIAFLANYLKSGSKVVFCDIGQGDGIYVRLENKFDMVIDAGPNSRILHCLGKHMPFYDKNIDLAIITNPDKDHYYGFIPIIERYTIQLFMLPAIDKKDTLFEILKNKIYERKIKVIYPDSRTQIKIGGSTILFFWPTSDFLTSSLFKDPNTGQHFVPASLDENDYSLVFSLKVNRKTLLFTGDATPAVLTKIKNSIPRHVNILKVPHHGSHNGLTKEFLSLTDPTLSVISVGKGNKYGHPSKQVLGYFESLNKKYKRTDIFGDILITL